MQSLARSRSLLLACSAVLMAATGACSAQSAVSATGSPATTEEAAKVLNLVDFPLVKDAEKPQYQRLAGLSYTAPGTVKDVFEFQRARLSDKKWKELPASYVSDQSANATFSRSGFSLSLMVFSTGQAGVANVSIINHGNVDLSKLPVPEGAKPFFAGPVSNSYITETSVAETAEACRKLLLEKGWQPYGTAGDVSFFKQNAIRLAARVSSAPAQGGKTVIDYSATLMSTDLPAPADTENLQYADTTAQLFFDTRASQRDVAEFYRRTLANAGWEATTENPVQIDFKKLLIFRNPHLDMLTLEMTEVDGKSRILVKHQSAADVAELERQIQAEMEQRKMEQNKPLPKVAVMLPEEAKDVEHSKARIEFKIATGKIKAVVETWRKQFAKDGWKEDVTALEDMIGSISFSKGSQKVSVSYDDTGILPAEVTLRGTGVELERAAEKRQK